MNTTGSETLYELSEQERYPTLSLSETDQKYAGEDGVIAVPAPLVKRLEKAREALREAEFDIARWVKYGTDATAKQDIKQIIDMLPSTEERKAARKR